HGWNEKGYPNPGRMDQDGDLVQAIPRPVIIDKHDPKHVLSTKSIIVEEPLSLEQMEKDMISRALGKHKGRRKEASKELGISERTLYRKIKQYNLDE
ncbi:MAG: helix-turn-helix domain-containing protein, partial [Saprospiraceae bacterium]|nr:helix-turn-helix domain-containing protein [Saprospiraceae bacterium]